MKGTWIMAKNMTFIEKIKRGDSPSILKLISQKEGVSVEYLMESICQGVMVIPSNRGKVLQNPCAIGAGIRTKVNANIGTSSDYPRIEDEIEKLHAACEAGADTVMDLSTGGPIDQVLEEIVAKSPVPVGSVPIYRAGIEAREKRGSIVSMTPDDMFDSIEAHCKAGVDFITVHCGVTQKAIEALRANPRIADIVSRGGAFLAGWIIHNEKENPLYEDFDRLLDIARKYEVTLSLGDGLRPGAIGDASDPAQIAELVVLGELVRRCRDAGVQCMVEGPGHIPLHQVEMNVSMAKAITAGSPFYVLGPLVTDVAPGYDHIVAAIGGAVAGMAGADFLCYVTPREHLGLPTYEDVREGVIVTRIAAHAADITKGIKGAREWDREMSIARKSLNWQRQMELAIDARKARRLFSERQREEKGACTMCGDFCAMRFVSQYLKAETFSCCD
jgi:phosphomethylpyrimidine synthase